jgi:hypothetical protein
LWPPLHYHLTLPRAGFVGKPPHHPLTGIGGLFLLQFLTKFGPEDAAAKVEEIFLDFLTPVDGIIQEWESDRKYYCGHHSIIT